MTLPATSQPFSSIGPSSHEETTLEDGKYLNKTTDLKDESNGSATSTLFSSDWINLTRNFSVTRLTPRSRTTERTVDASDRTTGIA